MLESIKVVPLAAESMGVRSMCTYVETPDVRVLLDAGVSLCPNRFGLPPHPKEFEAIIDCRKRIAQFADKAEIVTLSHNHFDHHTPSYGDWLSQWTEDSETARQIYQGKHVLMKNPRECINASQRHRPPPLLGQLLELTGFGAAEYRECRPVVRGAASLARSALWRALRQLLRIWNLAETGSAGSGILTRVFLASAVRR